MSEYLEKESILNKNYYGNWKSGIFIRSNAFVISTNLKTLWVIAPAPTR